MNTRLYNARILKMTDEMSIINGEVWVKGNIIDYVGADNQTPDYAFDQEIDCVGNLLMPGFKNAHAHAPMTFLRSFADDLPLQDWLFKQVFPAEGKLTGEDIYHLTKLAILEYLTSGITASFEMYFEYENMSRAAIEMGYRMVFCGSVSGKVNEEQSVLKRVENEYETYNHLNGLISYHLGFHAEYTASKELLEGMARIAEKYHAPVYTHNAETALEVSECIDRHGVSPTKLFHRLGIYQYGGGGFHLVYSDHEDMDILKKNHVYAVTNPGSNVKLASGIAPVEEMYEKGIVVAIGTDGPASNNSLDMFKEMFLTTGLQKIMKKDAAALSADKVLKMATVNGAKTMRLEQCDTLEEGKLADIIMIDLLKPNMQPINNIVKNLVYSGSKDNVLMTMIDGKILYANNEFTNQADIAQIYNQANAIITRIQKELSS